MGIFHFIKGVGDKIFGQHDDPAPRATPIAQRSARPSQSIAETRNELRSSHLSQSTVVNQSRQNLFRLGFTCSCVAFET